MKGSLGSRRRSSESGIALPMALIVLGLLTTLTLAFLAITVSEPSIAMNQMMNAQARAIAESGLERAIWALSKGETAPGTTGALDEALPSPVPAPYDGSQYVAMGAGGFIVTVADDAANNDRVVTSICSVPVHRQRHGHPEVAREGERDVLPGGPALDLAAAERRHLRRYAVRQSVHEQLARQRHHRRGHPRQLALGLERLARGGGLDPDQRQHEPDRAHLCAERRDAARRGRRQDQRRRHLHEPAGHVVDEPRHRRHRQRAAHV